MRQLFIFWQFNGDNSNWCNQKCPYCYGGSNKPNLTLWNGKVKEWTEAFERLNRDLYFTLSYGESMVSPGFYEALDIMGKHSNWECTLITNLSVNPEKMLNTKIAKDKRLYIIGCFHPMGGADWETFKKHVLMVRDAGLKLMCMYLMYPPQIQDFKKYFKWFDDNNIRAYVRRFVGEYDGKHYPEEYLKEDRQFLRDMSQPITIKYGLDLASPKGRPCSAGKDLILVKFDGTIGLCADCPNVFTRQVNIFDKNFKVNEGMIRCPMNICGGDYGMLHVVDGEFGDQIERLNHDCFIAQVNNIAGGGREKVFYPKRDKMNKWLESDGDQTKRI